MDTPERGAIFYSKRRSGTSHGLRRLRVVSGPPMGGVQAGYQGEPGALVMKRGATLSLRHAERVGTIPEKVMEEDSLGEIPYGAVLNYMHWSSLVYQLHQELRCLRKIKEAEARAREVRDFIGLKM